MTRTPISQIVENYFREQHPKLKLTVCSDHYFVLFSDQRAMSVIINEVSVSLMINSSTVDVDLADRKSFEKLGRSISLYFTSNSEDYDGI